jgi:hypothetical protein
MKKYLLLLTLAVILIGTVGQVFADPLVHVSREDFYDTGGTLITGCVGSGCPSLDFSYGDTSGTVLWEVVEKVFETVDESYRYA